MTPHARGRVRERGCMDASIKKEMGTGPFEGREWGGASARAEVVRFERKRSETPVQPGGTKELFQRSSREHVSEGWVLIPPSLPGLNIPVPLLSTSRARGRVPGDSMASGEPGHETAAASPP